MAWKKDGEVIVVQDGNPVWIHEDGKEAPFNAEAALKNLNDATAESVVRKKKLKDLEEKHLPFAGIEDGAGFLSKANAALETVKNLDDKKLIDAGKVEEIKRGVIESYDARIVDINKSHAEALKKATGDLETKDAAIRKMVVEGAFTRSKFLREKTVLPPEFAYNTFGKHFKVEEDGDQIKVSATDAKGNPIFSLKNPGQAADPEEAIEIIVGSHPQKDSILKGIAGGGGTPPGGGGGGGGGKTITRAQYDQMDPVARKAHFKDGGAITE